MLHMSNEWGLVVPSITDGTQPALAMDTTVTPGTNAMGSYAELIDGALVTHDIWEIEITINSRAATGRDHSVTIGVDPAAGTSYTDTITELIAGPSSPILVDWLSGCVVYRFPLRIKAGSSIAAKASASTGTTNIGVSCVLYGQPSRPELCRVGSFVTTLGNTLASSNGTAITPGTASEGSWTAIGSTLARDHFYVEFGYGINDTTMTAGRIDVDVSAGDGSNKRVIIRGAPILTATSNNMVKRPAGRYANLKTGDQMYARAQASATPDSTNSVAVYLVG
jgi:hypothetical protein